MSLLALVPVQSKAGDLHFGPLFDRSQLTLESGERTEIVAPFYYKEKNETQQIWAFPPFLSLTRDLGTKSIEFEFLYPLAAYDRYGDQYRWHFGQLLSYSGGPTQVEKDRDRFTIFPLYFQQRSTVPDQNYTAFVPFYGHLKNRLFRDEVFFIMMPFYVQSRKRDIVTDNYVYPFFHLRHGNGLEGWQFWPIVGHEHKDVTTRTNNLDETETIGGHDKWFAAWPLFAKQNAGTGTTNSIWLEQFLPFYSLFRSPLRDQTIIGWPFFSWIDDREKKYHEREIPWPFVVIARGEGKTTTRFFPFFSRAHTATLQKDFYLWPVYKYSRVRSEPLDRERTRILLFLFSDTLSKNTETGTSKRRTDLWPFFTYRRDLNGNTRLQVLAPLEPYVPASHKIERDYSPLWSVWREEKNAKTGAASQSLLWNLYRRESMASNKKFSLFFGLFQYQSDAEGKRMAFFRAPVDTKNSEPPAEVKQHSP